MEPLWSVVVATGGNGWQIETPENGSDEPKPLPSVTTNCRDERSAW
jgi:hypothetical protein